MSLTTAWRIVKRRHIDTAFSGEGARRFGGRWNRVGTPVAYAAESRALAALEVLVHLDPSERLQLFALVPVRFADALVEVVSEEELPNSWDAPMAPPEAAAFGTRWAEERRSAVLRVPSVVVPGEWNYLINPLHDGFAHLSIGPQEPFAFDKRLAL